MAPQRHSQPPSLQSLGELHGTDKASKHSYLPVYEMLFGHRRNESLTILEIGVKTGASINLWLDAFPSANVVGVDVRPRPKKIRLHSPYAHIHDDAYTDGAWEIVSQSGPFDVIIDDGPHTISSQRFAVAEYSKLLQPDGILIVEDVNLRALPSALGILGVNADALGVDYSCESYDLRDVKGRFDDVLFVVRRAG